MHRVIAASGLRVPHEDAPRTYVEATPIDVPDTTYYRRRLASGELQLAELAPAPDTEPAQMKKGNKA